MTRPRPTAASRAAIALLVLALGPSRAAAQASDASRASDAAPEPPVAGARDEAASPEAPRHAARDDAEPEALPVGGPDTDPSAPESPRAALGRAEPESPPVPSATEEAAELEAPPVRVHVRARRPGIELHVRLGSHVVSRDGLSRAVDDYTLVCAPAPCDADVPSGVRLFGLSNTEARAVPARELDLAAGREHTIELDFDDRSGWRTFGTVAALLAGVPGLVVLLASLVGPAVDHGPFDAVFVASGASLTALGIAALPLAAWGDTRVVELVEPGTTE